MAELMIIAAAWCCSSTGALLVVLLVMNNRRLHEAFNAHWPVVIMVLITLTGVLYTGSGPESDGLKGIAVAFGALYMIAYWLSLRVGEEIDQMVSPVRWTLRIFGCSLLLAGAVTFFQIRHATFNDGLMVGGMSLVGLIMMGVGGDPKSSNIVRPIFLVLGAEVTILVFLLSFGLLLEATPVLAALFLAGFLVEHAIRTKGGRL